MNKKEFIVIVQQKKMEVNRGVLSKFKTKNIIVNNTSNSSIDDTSNNPLHDNISFSDDDYYNDFNNDDDLDSSYFDLSNSNIDSSYGIIQISRNSKWGRLGIENISQAQVQCPSLHRSEDAFLKLNINEDDYILNKIEYSKSIRNNNTNIISNTIKQGEELQDIINISINKLNNNHPQDDNIFINTVSSCVDNKLEIYNKEKERIINKLENKMKKHTLDDFIHLGDVVIKSKKPTINTIFNDDEFYDTEEFYDAVDS